MSIVPQVILANEAAARVTKYTHQPPNTRRMYVGYQKQWEVSGLPPH